jgi:hypothetical protein
MLNNIDDIPNLLKEYPELHFKLLEVDYTNDQLLNFILKYNITKASDFNIINFKYFIMPENKNIHFNNKPTNPEIGELYYNKNDYKLMVYNGSCWQEVSN